jgi:hypothetical protein
VVGLKVKRQAAQRNSQSSGEMLKQEGPILRRLEGAISLIDPPANLSEPPNTLTLMKAMRPPDSHRLEVD